MTVRLLTAAASLLVTSSWESRVVAGLLPITPVTAANFNLAFPAVDPAGPYQAVGFDLGGKKDGELRSEVFDSAANTTKFYAYVYQILAPSDTALANLLIEGFGNPGVATIGGKAVQAITIGAAPLAGFPGIGTVSPTTVNSNFGAMSFEFSPALAAGTTSYIFGVFSTIGPTNTKQFIEGGTNAEVKAYQPATTSATPEPSTIISLSIGLIGAIAYARHVRLKAARYSFRRRSSSGP
jgi:hypothetical protein